MSLRARLLAGMAFVAAVLAIVSTVITITTRDQLMDQVDARLAAFSPGGRSGGFIPPPAPGVGDLSGPVARPDGFPERVSDAYQGFVDADGTLTTRFVPNVGDGEYPPPAIDVGELPAGGSRMFTTGADEGDVTYRVLAQRVGELTLITALPIDDVQSTIWRLLVVQVLGSLGILTALGLVSWWVVHLGIRPVREMTETATRIAEGDLTVRVPETAGGTEPGDLAVALNRMLGTIESALDERAESERRLRRFVADASHELRTPVTTIRGYAELYRHGGLRDHGALDDAMRRTEQEAARMGRLVEDMLTLAKLDEQRPPETKLVDLGALARDAAADARASAPDRDIDIVIDGQPTIVDGDEDRLRQVIANVVGNALVHTEPDVPVAMRVTRNDTDVLFEVEDHGHGMPSDVTERVVERFFRADPARTRHRGGSGLGLSIVDATVSAHGGTLDIDSTSGSGTTVRLTLPAADHHANT
jgi:two-component system, OmpR family, sensor kinase